MKKLLGMLGIIVLTSVSLSTFAYEHADGERDYGEFKEEMKEAIEANDYSLLSEEAQAEITEDEFAEYIEKHAERQEHADAVKKAVANNDFDAFVALHEEMKGMHEMNDDNDDDNDEDDVKKGEKLEKMKEHFASLVAYYNENGELPSLEKMKQYFGEKRMDDTKKQLTKKVRKHFKENHKRIIRKAVLHADAETLELLIERIEKRIESVEDNDSMNAERQEILLDMLGGILDTVEELLAEIVG